MAMSYGIYVLVCGNVTPARGRRKTDRQTDRLTTYTIFNVKGGSIRHTNTHTETSRAPALTRAVTSRGRSGGLVASRRTRGGDGDAHTVTGCRGAHDLIRYPLRAGGSNRAAIGRRRGTARDRGILPHTAHGVRRAAARRGHCRRTKETGGAGGTGAVAGGCGGARFVRASGAHTQQEAGG